MDGSSSYGGFAPSFLKASAKDDSSGSSSEEDDYQIPGIENDDGDNPRKRKRRKMGGNNKDKAALGIFGSDSEDDGPGRRWKSKSLRSRGMNFVSTGAAKADEDDDYDDSEEDMARPRFAALGRKSKDEDEDIKPVLGNGRQPSENEQDEDEDEPMAGIGLGFTGTKPQQTFAIDTERPKNSWQPQSNSTSRARHGLGGSSMLGGGFVPSSEAAPVLDEKKAAKAEAPRNTPQVSAFSSKSNGKINAKSFGARMMAKMGYVEGTGLGAEGQGRNVIIEANLRPQGIGLGAVKEKSEAERKEERRQAELKGEKVEESSDEEKKTRRRKAKNKTLGQAFDSAGSTPRRQKKKYLTADELKAQAPGLHIPEAFAPILDMTAPESKMLNSTSGIMTPTSGVPESTETIEAKKLVKRAHADLMAFSEEWKSLEERKTWVNLELVQRERELEDLRSDFAGLKIFTELISGKLTEASNWDDIMACLKEIAAQQTSSADISDVAVAVIYPYLRDPDWLPLENPNLYAADMKTIASLLIPSQSRTHSVDRWNSATATKEEGIYRTHHKATTPYESMMYKCFLPRVLSSIREWDPLDPAPMLSLVDAWDDLLPPFVRAQLVDAIVRALETALSSWNPKKRRQTSHLPHTWLFPWLQHLPSYHLDPKGTGLVAEVRRKYRHLIDAWDFSRGVVPGLMQWEAVLSSTWRSLIMSHVLPSMGKYIGKHFRVDPADQEPYMEALTGVLAWEEVIGKQILGEVLVSSVFPLWMQLLRDWMRSADVDLGEVAEWYSWWRTEVLKDCASHQGVRNEFDKGLRLMNTV